MKRAVILLAMLLSCAVCAFSREKAGPQERASVSLMGMYGWNETWRSHGGADLVGYVPVCKYFEAAAALELHGPKVFAATVTARPKYDLPFGELFADLGVHYRSLAASGAADFDLAASLGYRFDYLSAQIGVVSRRIFDLEESGASSSRVVKEPLNVLYRISFNVRPSTSRWNAGGGIANYTDFEYERNWAPIYFLCGHYDLDDNLSLLLRTDLKPSGAFNLTAQFWGVSVRAGVKYSF